MKLWHKLALGGGAAIGAYFAIDQYTSSVREKKYFKLLSYAPTGYHTTIAWTGESGPLLFLSTGGQVKYCTQPIRNATLQGTAKCEIGDIDALIARISGFSK